jgi:4-amino-4-deoxy-L-arabinose transferase-like glycosyltransferase
MTELSKNYWWWAIGLLTLVHLLGMQLIDIMEVDAAQYASISQEMLQSGDYLQVHHRSEDYLDKPPLLFWLTSFSFKLFGASNFSFRLPSFLFLIIGLVSTYKLASLLYDRRTGLLAVLVLYSSQAYFLFSHDVRTDTILANVVILAVWQLWVFMQERKLYSLLIGGIAVGLAMLEKGPIGVMVPVLALGSQILYKRQLKVLWRWEWLLGLVVIFLTISPMVYGLYAQFGAAGLEFYFWTQSFGRITGQSEWQDNSTIFYFVHTFLWAFLPWMFLAYFGVGKQLWLLVKNKFNGTSPTEIITLAGFLLTFIAMSLSRYKLPHYIFVVFPLVAIITANTIYQIIDSGKFKRLFLGLQWFIWSVLWIAVGLLTFGTFPDIKWYILLIAMVFLLGSFYFLALRKQLVDKLIYSALLTMIGVNFVLNTHFYPTLLNYQAGSVAGKYLAKLEQKPEVYSFKIVSHGLDFYSGQVAASIDANSLKSASGIWVYTNEAGKKEIEELGIKHTVVKSIIRFHVTGLTMTFLRPSTRHEALDERFLIEIN